MNYLAHAWIASRAIKLLEEEGSCPELTILLRGHMPRVLAGAWLVDQSGMTMQAGGDCHVLKYTPYTKAGKTRFIVEKDEFLNRLGTARLVPQYLRDHAAVLGDDWWKGAYRADVEKPGQHVANRAQAFSLMMLDLLVLANNDLYAHTLRQATIAKSVDTASLTNEEQAAFHFFILSHFVADSTMPCHCDKRLLSKCTPGSLHDGLEDFWSDLVQNTYKGNCTIPRRDSATVAEMEVFANTVYQDVKAVDNALGIAFTLPKGKIPDLMKNHDVWWEMVDICRASFAIASIIADYKVYPYDKEEIVSLDTLFPNPKQSASLQELNRVILHDAVLNVAIVWKSAWNAAT